MSVKETEKKVDKILEILERTNIVSLYNIMGNKKEIIKRNFLAGLFRGIGIGIGITLMTAIIIYILQKIILLNIPIISDYIVDVVEIVQKNM